MGAGASLSATEDIHVTTANIRSFRAAICDTTDVINRFTEIVFKRSFTIEALNKALSNHHGRTSYMEFLRDTHDEMNMRLWLTIEGMRTEAYCVTSHDTQLGEALVGSYYPDEDKSAISDKQMDSLRRLMTSNDESREKTLNSLAVAEEQTITIVALTAAAKFLKSNYNFQWQMKVVNDERLLSSLPSIDVTDIVVAKALHRQIEMSGELSKILKSSSWLRAILPSMESLPVSITLAAGTQNMRGFPLLYVNAAFEDATGYHRSEILGQNCRFLQSGKKDNDISEKESVDKLSFALKEGESIRVSLTNYKKDGTPFRNLLAMKPILDENGKYAFVLGIQFPIIGQDASLIKLKIVDEIFRLLPDTVSADFEFQKPIT